MKSKQVANANVGHDKKADDVANVLKSQIASQDKKIEQLTTLLWARFELSADAKAERARRRRDIKLMPRICFGKVKFYNESRGYGFITQLDEQMQSTTSHYGSCLLEKWAAQPKFKFKVDRPEGRMRSNDIKCNQFMAQRAERLRVAIFDQHGAICPEVIPITRSERPPIGKLFEFLCVGQERQV